MKSRRGPAESCTTIPSRNHPGGSILAAIMAQFLTAINKRGSCGERTKGMVALPTGNRPRMENTHCGTNERRSWLSDVRGFSGGSL